MIENDEEEVDEVVDAGLRSPVSPARTLVEGDHTLVEIIEETPPREIVDDQDSSPEV